ncbi:di-heme oxidoredictase family protein [Flavobacterium cellulosilyticum]|uniref:Thiol oxidoreductase n=1 Tax=Flavobacterium cellulosilyticum TaxID=2541731 RepID=A0A4R5CFY3_9FLAO|nr:di-heme oxidoredictase family protein [Flavobacterium cellulosilyticum]TDD97906.1 thiol oxidoreductase [Flavobacterium cellulosilyticum]
MKNSFLITILLSSVAFTSCETNYTEIPADDTVLDGTVEGLSHEESARFLRGDEAFSKVFTRGTGLGPTYVSTSCVSCHTGDGKGHPSTILTRFGQIDETGNLFLNQGGPQLQNRSLPGYFPEQVPFGATFTKFTAPATTGLGFLEALSDADILAMADPNDMDGDGISGVPNWIDIPDFVIPSSNAISQNGKYIGRYGKKAAAHSLLHQTANAYNQDMGITSIFRPIDTYSHLEIDPEVATSTVNDVVFYLRTLKAPIQRNQNDAVVNQGAAIFNQINCTGCHKTELKTGNSPIAALSYKTFAPYTDLLLHDMGSGLDDNYTEGNAKTYEWKTPALWGLGLSGNSQGGNFFLMHDGRARSVEEAILMHGGEATASKINYQNLTQSDKAALLKFMKSL